MISQCQKPLTSLLTHSIKTQRLRHIVFALHRSMSSNTEDDVLTKVTNNRGIITLNRPKALNSLNASMVTKLQCILKQWEQERSMVIIKGAGGKAFCAGGDVVFVTKGGDALGKTFFRDEYTLNSLIGTYHIPYIALIDGITMGGGVGVSVHAQYRVATEKTLFAMPETAIGLFPDVGGSFFLPRLGGKLGLYLALTGHRLKGADVLKAGIATHYCESAQIPELEKALVACDDEPDVTLKRFSKKPETEFSLSPYLAQIDECFSAPCVEGIYQRLEKDGSEWAMKTLATMKTMSPTSMKVTLKELEEGATKDLQECLQMEYRLARRCLQSCDFYEGVRALLVDKDKKPIWKPATLEEVTDEYVNKFFAELPADEELQL